MTTTWNPSDKTTDCILTGSNLIATANNTTHAGARGTTGKSAGKWMLQFTSCTLNAADTLDYVGIGTAADTLGLASGSQVQVILIVAGTSFSGDGSSANTFGDGLTIGAGATVDLCVDLSANLFWFRVNGGNWNASGTANPSTGVGGHAIKAGGTFLPYVRLTGSGKTATLNPSPTGDATTTGFAAWDSTSGPTGTWASTEATDKATLFGYQPNSGTLSVTENADSWSSSPGFARLEVESADNPFSATTFNISTSGPDRIIVIGGAGVAVTGFPDQITAISDAAGLTWHHEYFVGYGPDEFSDNAVMQLWWAHAHNKLTSDAVTVTLSGGTSTTNYVVDYIVIKGLNGNYETPFDRINPLANGSAIGALFPPPNTAPASFMPIATGPMGTSSGHTTLANAVGAVLSGGSLTITSTGTGAPTNYARGVISDGLPGGTKYFESKFANIAGTHYGFGVIWDETDPATFVTAGTGGAIVRGDGSIWSGGSSVGSLGDTPAANDIIACAVSIDNHLVWFKNVTQGGQWNGSLNGDPFHGTGGLRIAHIASDSISPIHSLTGVRASLDTMLPISVVDGTSSSAQQVLNFGATSFGGTLPSGFTGWQGTASALTHTQYPSIVIGLTFSVTGTGTPGATEAPPGFTQNALRQVVGSQRTTSLSMHTKLCSQNILISDNELMQQADTTGLWGMMYATVVVGTVDPGSWESTETADAFHAVGHPGASGIVGDLTATESPDIFAANGFERDSGVFVSTEAKDTFSAFGFQPLTGVWHSTESKDIFAATGLGRGENGTWSSTESVDTFAGTGHTPVSGLLFGIEAPDRFLALGAGVTRVRSRRVFSVT